MPLYEFECASEHRTEMILDIVYRDSVAPVCEECGGKMKRLPGGHGLLYYEEGRPRKDLALGATITSKAQHERLMRINGVVQSDDVPKSVARNPKSIAMKRHLERDKKGRWV